MVECGGEREIERGRSDSSQYTEVHEVSRPPFMHQRLLIENQLGDEVDLEALRQKSDGMSGNSVTVDENDLLRREGGSGLLKIHKILRYDLRLDGYDVQLRVLAPATFSVAVSI